MPQESTRRVIRSSRKSPEHTIKQESQIQIDEGKVKKITDDTESDETIIFENSNWKEYDMFVELLDEIKNLQKESQKQKNPKIQDKYKIGILLCATIKKLNRISVLRVNKARNKTCDVKNKIDEDHLELQNLLYEVSHIKKEINKCLEFRSLDEDINLIPVEEFYKNAPESISRPDVTKIDEHKLKLARLDWELNERQSMLSKIKELESSIEKYQTDIKTRREQLDSLQPKLNQIIDACKPTLDYFNTNFSDENSANINEYIQLLPKPLYTLYMMLNGYKDMVYKLIKIEVMGDLDEAKLFDYNKVIDLDDEESDSGVDDDNENENYKKKKSKSKTQKQVKNSKDKVFTPYPLYVKVTFGVKNVGQIMLNVHYLDSLKIVTVKSDIKLEMDTQLSDSLILRPDTLFTCLYPNDTGLDSPNLSNKFIFNSLGITSIESYLTNIGYPYRWCQVLCGLYYYNSTEADRKEGNETENNNGSVAAGTTDADNAMLIDEPVGNATEKDADLVSEEDYLFGSPKKKIQVKNESKLMEAIIAKLILRFRTRAYLQETVNTLKKCIVPSVLANSGEHRVRNLISKIIGFKESTFENFVSCGYTDHLISANLIDENHDIFYEITLQNAMAKLQAQIVISQNYPSRASLFAINIDWKSSRNYKNDEAIRDMERELNLCLDNFNDNNRSKTFDLVVKQINHLLVCFDIYLETESYTLENDEFPRSKFYLNAVRGKDRKRPYSYVSTKDIFMQRLQFTNDAPV